VNDGRQEIRKKSGEGRKRTHTHTQRERRERERRERGERESEGNRGERERKIRWGGNKGTPFPEGEKSPDFKGRTELPVVGVCVL
jgi:hypothetical protein